MKKLFDFAIGQSACLIDFGQTNYEYRRKLLSLGITRGTEIKIARFAPLGCPIQIEVRGSLLALRKEDICHVEWELV
ncbi:MAG: FeoA family protein [Legionellaceae bacterium]|nr:FeoA family protein [Legionellaceae bacterium]